MTASTADILLSRVPSLGERRAVLQLGGPEPRSVTWRSLGETVSRAARALMASGVAPGERIALLGGNTAEWIAADWAILATGAVSFAIHPDFSAARTAGWLREARGAFIEGPERLARLRAAGADLASLRPLVLLEGSAEGAETWSAFLARGEGTGEEALRARAEAIGERDPAAAILTSGATGEPRTALLPHGALGRQAAGAAQAFACSSRDSLLHGVSLACPMARALHLAAAALGASTVVTGGAPLREEDLAAASPSVLHAEARFAERLYGAFLDRYEDAGPERQERFRAAVKAGRRMSECLQRGEPVPYDVGKEMERAHREVLGEFRDRLGGSLRFFTPSRSVLPPEIAEFYHACGALTLGGYGLAEAAGFLSLGRFDRFRFGAAGAPLPGVDLRISPEGEILARAPWAAAGEDGLLATGDAGQVDAAGTLHFFARRADVFSLRSGERAAPAAVEKMLRGDPFIAHAAVFGSGKPFLTALLDVDVEEVRSFARRAGAPEEAPEALLRSEDLRLSIEETVREVNAHLREPMQIGDYRLLPRPLSAEMEELTPYGEARRAALAQRYHDLIEDMYR